MTLEEIDKFEKLQSQLASLHFEVSALSRKSQNDPINKFKLKFVNKAIEDVTAVLGEKYRPFEDFDQFQDDDLPSNSDVTMILGQYLNCMEKLRSDNLSQYHGLWYWKTDEGVTEIKTSAPDKLKKK